MKIAGFFLKSPQRIVALGPLIMLVTAPCVGQDDVSSGEVRTFAGIQFVWIPPGSFRMGSDHGKFDQPPHDVTLTKGFWIGKYEITKAEWLAVMDSGPWNGKDGVNEDLQTPAEYISWYDAQGFIKVINTLGEGVFRLPTEAEWEYVCRAGSATRYTYGDDPAELVDYAWYQKGLKGQVDIVGRRKPNAWGLYDVHGNVWEWCQDWFAEEYPSAMPVTDPAGAPKGRHGVRIYRGGGYGGDADECGCSVRNGVVPWKGWNWQGLRLVRNHGTGPPPGDRDEMIARVSRDAEQEVASRTSGTSPQTRRPPDPKERELVEAAGRGDRSAAERLIAGGVDINAVATVTTSRRSTLKLTPLANAILNGHTETAIWLLEVGANPVLRAAGQTPFEMAAASDSHAIIERLSELGAVPDIQSLLAACESGNAETAAQLLDFGIDGGMLGPKGRSPLGVASGHFNAPVVELLLQHGVDPNRRDGYGDTALLTAAKSYRSGAGHREDTVFRILLEHGADPNIIDARESFAPLHLVAYWAAAPTIEVFLERGADPNLRDGAGRTVLDVVSQRRDAGPKEVVIEAYGGKRTYRMPWIPILVGLFLLSWVPVSVLPRRFQGLLEGHVPGSRFTRVVARAHLRLCAIAVICFLVCFALENRFLDHVMYSHEQNRTGIIMFIASATFAGIEVLVMVALQFLKPTLRRRLVALGVGITVGIVVLGWTGLLFLAAASMG